MSRRGESGRRVIIPGVGVGGCRGIYRTGPEYCKATCGWVSGGWDRTRHCMGLALALAFALVIDSDHVV